MASKATNIHPVFDRILTRTDKENRLNQRAKVIWLTGLSGSGKSTIAVGLERKLQEQGYLTQILDGDNVRTGINNNLGFSDEDRTENIRRIAEVSKLFMNCGIITINSFVSPTLAIREQARQIIGEEDFLEVYINVPLEVAEQRDVKGLYKKARAGEIKDFTGINAPFEAPENPFLVLNTHKMTIEESVDSLFQAVIRKVKYSDQQG